MWGLILIFSTALLVGFSGALMPGPLTAVTIRHTFHQGYQAAPLVTLGHAVLEVVMVILLLLGLGNYLALPYAAGIIGTAGGLVLFWMGWNMIRSAVQGTLSLKFSPRGDNPGKTKGSAFRDGLIATACNPYWFLWWATVGAGYVALSQNSGLPGVFFFFGGHILADFIWISLLAAVLVPGKRWLTDCLYKWIVFGLGIFLCVFSLYFFRSGLRIFLGR